MNLWNAHTFNLGSQGNIYTQTVIKLINGSCKLLVAALSRKVSCFDLSMTHSARPCGCVVVPQTQELQFTYLPPGAEIISIHAFNRSSETNDFVIGVTIIKGSDSGSQDQYINIYSEWEPGTELQLDSLAQGCLSLELRYIPYQLGHCQVGEEKLWILGGSDNRIHVFSEDKLRHMYCELEVENSLVEFQDPYPSVPLYTDTHTENGIRTVATVCECGFLKLTMVDEFRNEILKIWTRNFEGPLTCVIFMKPSTSLDFLFPSFIGDNAKLPRRETEKNLSMVVTCSIGESLVYSDVTNLGLESCERLEQSDAHDIVTSAWVDDLTFDGNLTILLGTHGLKVLAYRREDSGWKLKWEKRFPAPILGIRYADLTGDGVKELIVITTCGVQVLQHDLEAVKETALRRLNTISRLIKNISN